MQHKDFFCEIKSLNEDGTFEGTLSPYGNVDEGNDVVEFGAYTKTLRELGNTRPMLWQHKTDLPIGLLELTDRPEGLHCKGTLALEVPQAQIAYSLIKRRIVRGLSIGFETVKDAIEGGVRHLKELRLMEGSIVTFPMNLQAVIASVKAAKTAEYKDDFTTELQQIQLYSARYMMQDALSYSLSSIIYDSSVADKVAASKDSIQQFSDAYIAMLPDYLALMADESGGPMGWMSRPGFEQKAGRVLSQANLDLIAKVIKDLQALYDVGVPADGAAKGTGTSEIKEAATQHSIEPDAIHSALQQYQSKFAEVATWNN